MKRSIRIGLLGLVVAAGMFAGASATSAAYGDPSQWNANGSSGEVVDTTNPK